MSDYLNIDTADSPVEVAEKVAAAVTNPQRDPEQRRNRPPYELTFMYDGWPGLLMFTFDGEPFITVHDGSGRKLFRKLARSTDWQLSLEDERGNPITDNFDNDAARSIPLG